MSRRFSLALSFCLSFLFNQPLMLAADRAPSSPLQLVYLQNGTTLTTYSVDPQTLYASEVGQFNLPMTAITSLVPSLNGEFLYMLGFDSAEKQHLWVFATDASGLPQSPAVQELDANGLNYFEFDPAANFAYAVLGTPTTNSQTLYSIERFSVDSATGELSAPAVVARYPLNGPCALGATASPGLYGFGANGQKFYDDWFCNYPYDDINAIYYERTINAQTGALGKEVQIFNWDNGSEGFQSIAIGNNQLIDFDIPNDFQQGISTLDIYPVVPNSNTPTLQCAASMLEACGYAVGEIVHPSGKYIFFLLNDYTDQIASIDLAAGKLVDTGNYIPYDVATFSPDGTLVYGLENLTSSYYIQIYGFNPANANVTYNGGVIYAPSDLDNFWTVARQ